MAAYPTGMNTTEPTPPPASLEPNLPRNRRQESLLLPQNTSKKENIASSSPQRRTEWPLPSLPIDYESRAHAAPPSSAHVNAPPATYSGSSPRTASFELGDDLYLRQPIRRSTDWESIRQPDSTRIENSEGPPPPQHKIPFRQRFATEVSSNPRPPQAGSIPTMSNDEQNPSQVRSNQNGPHYRNASGGSHGSHSSLEKISENAELNKSLQPDEEQADPGVSVRFGGSPSPRPQFRATKSASPPPRRLSETAIPSPQHLGLPRNNRQGFNFSRPASAYSSHSDHGIPVRTRSPQFSPSQYDRTPSANSGRSPDSRPVSYVDLLNVPYPQPPPAPSNLDNAHLRTAVGNNASLLSTKQTLDMYRANVKKTNDPTIQYEFAIFMINTAQEVGSKEPQHSASKQTSSKLGRNSSPSTGSQADLLREARNILQKLSERSYPYAQYYLADGYASGLFNKGNEDYDRAFPLFIAASKHGHAEAGYRAALCYEFGWGTRKDVSKAVQFYRQSASKNHPGAMTRLGKACLFGDMGLGSRFREGLKWLKRAAESADYQYNSAPYELGLLHETGHGDDIFRDESYAAQLFTQSADLGHPEANYRLGDAYEHGRLGCPRDPALSVHFYTGAAQLSHPLAQMALCAWYMVGAEPVLEKNENEAYEWARKAAESGKQRKLVHLIHGTKIEKQ